MSKSRVPFLGWFFLFSVAPFCFLATLGGGTLAWAANESYGAHGLYPQGSTRLTAMGGAYVGLSDDISAFVYNPAGLALSDWWGDLGGNFNYVFNLEADLNGDGKRDGLPYMYANYAAALHLGNWAFGLGFSTPYAINLTFDSPNGAYVETRTLNLSIFSLNLPLAYRINKEWAAGVIFRVDSLSEQYASKSTNPATQAVNLQINQSVANMSAGVAYRPSEVWGLGAAYHPFRKFQFNYAVLNAQTAGTNWFRDVFIPEKVQLGGFYRPRPSITLVADIDFIGKAENCVYVGSDLVSGFRHIEVDPSPKTVLHGGFEWHPIETTYWDFHWRMGTYLEPARLVGNDQRQHFTAGLEFRFWLLDFSASVDTAADFGNFAGGLGVSFKNIF